MTSCGRSLFFYRSGMTTTTRHSRALVSVAAALFLFKRWLTDTCVLGNLPKTGTGFGKVHANLREIPEGDEKYGRWRSLFFYRSRMTELGLPIFGNYIHKSASRIFTRRHEQVDIYALPVLALCSLPSFHIKNPPRLALLLYSRILRQTRMKCQMFFLRIYVCNSPIFLSFENDEVGVFYLYHPHTTPSNHTK